MKNVRKNRLSRQLLTATLLLGGTFNLVSPVLAQTAPTTTAGTQIRNQATATYEDPNTAGVSINATSNTVILTVAEVAGITITSAGITDTSPSTAVITGDVLNYDYLITNVGNDPTKFFIPGVATVTGGTAGTLQISTDGGSTYTNIASTGITTGSIAPGGSVKVRVPVTVNATSGQSVSVVLGNTGANDNSAGTQNQLYPTAPSGNDVYTVDNTDGSVSGETTGAPVNGEREASLLESIQVGATPQAFATVLKTRTNYTNSGTVNALNDDVLTYGLGLRVESTAPSGIAGVVAARLVGTNINVNGIQVSRVLVSDAIPAGTKLRAAPTNVPSGWQAVYTTDAITTNANAANWSTTVPGDLTTVTRVGFINAGPIATGTTVTGLSFQVVTSGVTQSTATVSNIAQVFGQSENAGTTLIYDESGDQNPSNFNDGGTPGSNTPTNGVANPETDGSDPNNNNTGSGAGGEVNAFTFTVSGSLVNGPNGQPGAVGPTDNNNDFANKSTPVPAGTAPDATIDPDAVTFTNTVSNPGATAISNVYIIPDDGNATGSLPTNTTVTMSYNGNTSVYTYNGTDFAFTSGTPIVISSITPAGQISYTASVDLPNGTTLSSTTGNPFAVPLRAFIDSNNDNTFDTGESNNITIDQVYTGYLKLVKQAQILSPSGQPLTDYFTTPSANDAQKIQPGNIIQYRISYTNISSGAPQAGSGNATLRADKVVITEDGATAPNNWAIDQDKNNTIDTSNVVGKAADTAGTITFFSGTSTVSDRTGTTPTTDVTKYLDTLNAPLDPGATGTFTFQRKINQ